MEKARAARYADKLAHAEHRLAQFTSWASDARGVERDRLASYKALQEAAEAILDVVAMLVKDSGAVPKDDYTNVDIVAAADILSKGSAEAVTELNGLRNRLVHEYNGLSDDKALDSAERLVPLAFEAVEEVRTWLTKQI